MSLPGSMKGSENDRNARRIKCVGLFYVFFFAGSSFGTQAKKEDYAQSGCVCEICKIRRIIYETHEKFYEYRALQMIFSEYEA